MTLPMPGDYLVTSTKGLVPWLIRKFSHSSVNHAALALDPYNIIEAQPKGAVLASSRKYKNAIWSNRPLTDDQRHAIIAAGWVCEGTPYNFLDIVAQAIVRIFKVRAPKWVLNRVSNPKTLQCAQLVDYCYSKAGVNLFKDNRPDGLVSPGDLLEVKDG